MQLIETITSDINAARKAHQPEQVGALVLVRDALIKAEKEALGKPVDPLAVLRKQLKQRVEAAEAYETAAANANDTDRERYERDAAAERYEASLIEAYLPSAPTAEELAAAVATAIDRVGATEIKQMGLVIKEVMSITEGRADGKSVSTAVKAALAG
jgi:uncharacterized protein